MYHGATCLHGFPNLWSIIGNKGRHLQRQVLTKADTYKGRYLQRQVLTKAGTYKGRYLQRQALIYIYICMYREGAKQRRDVRSYSMMTKQRLPSSATPEESNEFLYMSFLYPVITWKLIARIRVENAGSSAISHHALPCRRERLGRQNNGCQGGSNDCCASIQHVCTCEGLAVST
jgi:hypothetical protein